MQPVITSRHNTRVRELRSALASRRAETVVGIEGPHLLREALAADSIDIVSVFAREDRAALLESVPESVERIILNHAAFESVAATEHSQGIAALIVRPMWDFTPHKGDLVLVLDAVQDPGNVGTLVRSAEAFGAAAVMVTAGTADLWNGKALRAAAGAAFRIPVVRWTEPLATRSRSAGIRLLAAVASAEGASGITDTRLTGGCALIIGNEGKGVSPELLAQADARVTLPMHGRTESLNAAVAGSILLYEAARQRADAVEENSRTTLPQTQVSRHR